MFTLNDTASSGMPDQHKNRSDLCLSKSFEFLAVESLKSMHEVDSMDADIVLHNFCVALLMTCDSVCRVL